MARQTPNERAEASQQRLNNRTHDIRSNRTTREKRLGREIVDDLSNLLPPPPQPTLRKEEPRGGIPAARGYAERNYQPGDDGGGGIAGPLTEVPDTRIYHEDVVHRMYSSDYLLAAEICPLASMKMLDAEDREVVFNFAPPAWVGE